MSTLLVYIQTVQSIAEKTGFSETTVRRRAKMAELDKELTKSAVERGATLMDFERLEKINDPDLKKNVLEAIGTKNFEWQYKLAVDEEKKAERSRRIAEFVKGFAVETEYVSGMRYCTTYYDFGSGDLSAPADAGSVKYFYKKISTGAEIYREYTEEEQRESKERSRKTQEEQERNGLFKELAQRAYELRSEFVHGLSPATAKKKSGIIMRFAVDSLVLCAVDWQGRPNLLNAKDTLAELPDEKALLLAAYYNLLDDENETYAEYSGTHKENGRLDFLYDVLEKLGYEISDEERAWRDGTHELYIIAEGAK